MASKTPNQQLLKPPQTKMVHRRVFVGYLMLLTRRALCQEFSRCYDDVNICFWTNGSRLMQSAAQAACQQRMNSFLPHITNRDIQDKMRVFREAAGNLLHGRGFWIDVKAVDVDGFHWIDGSTLPGLFCLHEYK